jgi:hypothetical protein
MKTALYLGGKHLNFSFGFFNGMPGRLFKCELLSTDIENTFIILEVFIWKFGIELVWFA